MLFSQSVFDWILTLIVTGLCTVWIFWDGPLLVRLLRESSRDESRRGDKAHADKIFGSIIGLALCMLGLLGVLNFHLKWGW